MACTRGVFKCAGVSDRGRDTFAEFLFTSEDAGDAAFAGGPIPGWHVDQNIFEI